MESRTFFKQIQEKKIEAIYLLEGEEEYAKDRAVEFLAELIEPSIREFNVDYLDNPTMISIIETATTLPMMSDRRIVFLFETRYFELANSSESKKLIQFLDDIPKGVSLIFVQRGKVDARKVLYKTISQKGNVVSFDHYSEEEATRWCVKFARDREIELSLKQAQVIIMMRGRDLNDLSKEMAKLCDYVGKGATISQEHIEKQIQPNMEYTVFEMMECFINGKNQQGFLMLDEELKNEGISAVIKLISFFASRFKAMLIAARALKQGKTTNEAIRLIGGNAYAAKKSIKTSENFSIKQLENALIYLANMDISIKLGQINAQNALYMIAIHLFDKKMVD